MKLPFKFLASIISISFFLFLTNFLLFREQAEAQEDYGTRIKFLSNVIGESYQSNEIIIEKQDYIDAYFEWQFMEINNTHWLAKFTINQTFWKDATYCRDLIKPTEKANCFLALCNNYFFDYLNCSDSEDRTKLLNDITNFVTYPLRNLTENIRFSDFQINLEEGTASFYIIFPNGFKVGKRAEFGFNSTIISTTTTIPFYPNQRAICRDSNGNIHVVWLYNSTSIYYAKSSDGNTWQVNTSFYKSTSTLYTPHISCDGNNITVAFAEGAKATIGISEDSGLTWGWKTPRTSCVYSFVLAERRGNKIYVIYQTSESSTCGYFDIRFFNSSDGGNSWGNDIIVFDGDERWLGEILQFAYYYYKPSLAVSGTGGLTDTIHVVAESETYDVGTFYYYISYRNSTDSGASWKTEKTLISTESSRWYYPSITFNGSKVYVTYYSDDNKTYFNYSSDYGGTWQGERIDTISDLSKAQYASVTIDDKGYPIVFWHQNSTSENKRWNIVYRKYNGTQWLPLGGVYNITTDIASDNMYVNTKYNFNFDRIEFVWRNGTASPYNIIYGYIFIDKTPPTYSLNSTNSTIAGSRVSHNLFWQDNVGLSYAIFSFDNCTGSLQDISGISLSGTSAWSNFTVGINSTVGCTIRWCVYANDTSNNWNGTSCQNPFSYTTTSAAYLEVNLISPPPSYTISQNSTFWINASVTCKQGNCGEVFGTARYNSSSENPDKAINTTPSEPFYILDSWNNSLNLGASNFISCGILNQDQTCNLSWLVNATGNANSYWRIGVLFNSSLAGIQQNHTINSTVYITEYIESLSLSWLSIDFGPLIPSTPASSNPAPGNENKLYNITNTGTSSLKIWIKGSDLQNTTYNSFIGIGNLSWSNVSNIYDPSTVYQTTYYYNLVNPYLTPSSNQTIYFWLSVPAVYAGIYKGTITICGNYSSICD